MNLKRTARFTLTADDMVAAAKLFSRQHLMRPRTLVSFLIIYVLIAMVFSSIGGAENIEALLGRMPFSLLLALIPFLLMGIVIGISLPLGARRVFIQQKTLHGEVNLEWDDARLVISSAHGQAVLPWTHFSKWIENTHLFMAFESDRLYRILPKRALTEEQIADLRHNLQTITG